METTQGSTQGKFVAWRVVPYFQRFYYERAGKLTEGFLNNVFKDVYEDHAEAVESAKKLDGDGNWLIEGLTQERYDLLS